MKKLIGLTAVAGLALMLSACWGDTAPANNISQIDGNATSEKSVANETAGNEALVTDPGNASDDVTNAATAPEANADTAK